MTLSNTTAKSLGIFDLKDLTELNAALGKIGLLSASGNTNYEAALQAALNWVNTPSTDSNAMLGGYHFPFPAAGKISKDGQGYVFTLA